MSSSLYFDDYGIDFDQIKEMAEIQGIQNPDATSQEIHEILNKMYDEMNFHPSKEQEDQLYTIFVSNKFEFHYENQDEDQDIELEEDKYFELVGKEYSKDY